MLEWPNDGHVRVPVSNGVRSARVLGMHEPLTVQSGENGVSVVLPSKPVDPVVTVVALELDGEPRPVTHR